MSQTKVGDITVSEIKETQVSEVTSKIKTKIKSFSDQNYAGNETDLHCPRCENAELRIGIIEYSSLSRVCPNCGSTFYSTKEAV